MEAKDNTPVASLAGPTTPGRFVSQLTRETFALVLAGGRGSRLGALTDWRAKPAVPFGGKFRIIDFTLSNCVNSGIRRIGVATQYKSHSLIRHIQRGWSFLDGRFDEFIQLLPAQQQISDAWYVGTADAVYQNIGVLRRHAPRFVLVLAGDHVYKMDYGRMLAAHVNTDADVTVACVEVPLADAAGALGVMAIDEGLRVVNFAEKPAHPAPMPGRETHALASMGIYLFGAQFLYDALCQDADDPASSRDFGRDIIPRLIGSGRRIYAHRFADSSVGLEPSGAPYWRDVGTIDAYWEANMDLAKVNPALNLYDREWPIWTYQAQMPPAKFVLDEDERRGMAVDSLISGGCVVSGSVVRRSLLFSDVHVDCHSLVEDTVVLPQVRIGQRVVLKSTVIDRGCRIADDTVIGVDADADRRRFHRTDRGVTLVTPDMLGQPLHSVR
ncbi:MAG TPA: glucose-1-phosphate adenylyltransferase [Burkholderiales bacterium]